MEQGVFWEYSIQYQKMLEATRKNPRGRPHTIESELRGKHQFKSPRMTSKGGNAMETKVHKYKVSLNNKFFHLSIIIRRMRNAIDFLKNQQGI